MNINKVAVVGNVVREPEVRFTPQGTPVSNVSIGVNESFISDNEKRNVTTFLDIRLWGKSAENFASLVKKGQEIFIEGALRQDQWTDKETGQNRSKLFVNATNWQFTQRKAPVHESGIER